MADRSEYAREFKRRKKAQLLGFESWEAYQQSLRARIAASPPLKDYNRDAKRLGRARAAGFTSWAEYQASRPVKPPRKPKPAKVARQPKPEPELVDDCDSPALARLALAAACDQHLADLRRFHEPLASLAIPSGVLRSLPRCAQPVGGGGEDLAQTRFETRVRSRQRPSPPKPFDVGLFV